MDLRSGLPFWMLKDGLPFDYPKLEQNLSTDVLIIGGGISGALCCYYLSQAGIDCAVVDRRTIGLGSTCASTSLLQYEIDTPLHQLISMVGENAAVKCYKLCEEAVYKLGDIAEKIGLNDFQLKKSLLLASYKSHIELVEQEFRARKKCGFKVILLTQNDIENHFPFSAPLAILSACGGQTDAYLFTHYLLQASLKNKAQVYDRTAITHIDHQPHSVNLKTEEGHHIKAKKVIYATGYESVNYIKSNQFELFSTYAIVSEQFSHNNFWDFNNCLIWETSNPYLYLRTTNDKRIAIGGKDVPFYDPKQRDALLSQKKKLLENAFHKMFPSLPFKTEFSWCGTFVNTPDGLPFIGCYPHLKNGYFSLGFGGNGITFSLVAAEIITGLILNKPKPYTSLFSFER